MYKYTITYSSGATEDIESTNESAELQSNSTFGMGLAQATEMGCNVVLVEDTSEPEEFVPTEGEITSFSQESKTFAETRNDYSETLQPGQKVTLTAVDGEEEAKSAFDGQEAVIIEAFPVGLQLDLDLSEADVEGLTAKFSSLEPEPVTEPVPPPPENPDAGEDPGLVLFNYFSRATPTVALVRDTDVQKIKPGDVMTLTAVAGLEDMMALADGRSGEIQLINGQSVQMSIDMSDVDTTGLAMTAMGTPIDGGGGNVDPPDPGDATGTITSFTAAGPTEVEMDVQDTSMLKVGDFITLEGLTGDPASITLIHDQRVEVLTKDPITLDLDLTGYDVTDLTADFLMDAPPVPGTERPPLRPSAAKPSAAATAEQGSLPAAPTDSPQAQQAAAPPPPPPSGTVPPWSQPSEPVQDMQQAAADASKPTPLNPDTGT